MAVDLNRLSNLFDKHGETFLINGVTSVKGFLQLIDQMTMSTYFDSIEQASILRPGLMVMVPGSTTAAVNDTITRDGRTFTIKKISNVRYGDTLVLRYLVLA